MTIYEFHTAIDELLAGAIDKLADDEKPCCSRCTNPHCCSEPAFASAGEVQVMLSAITNDERAAVAGRARHWQLGFAASPLIRQEEPNAFAYRDLQLPCPFLQAGRCLAYAVRPMCCRAHFALGNPEDCAMPARRHQKYAAFPHPNPMDAACEKFYLGEMERDGYLELDHIGAHLIRMVLGNAEFTTAAHTRVALTTS